jgi:hypothetical protein
MPFQKLEIVLHHDLDHLKVDLTGMKLFFHLVYYLAAYDLYAYQEILIVPGADGKDNTHFPAPAHGGSLARLQTEGFRLVAGTEFKHA